MAKRKKPISEQLRQAIKDCERTVYRISKDCEIAESQLHNFQAGKCGLGQGNIDRLCDYLGLELKATRRSTLKK